MTVITEESVTKQRQLEDQSESTGGSRDPLTRTGQLPHLAEVLAYGRSSPALAERPRAREFDHRCYLSWMDEANQRPTTQAILTGRKHEILPAPGDLFFELPPDSRYHRLRTGRA